ncbi:MAG: hypothetical protein KKG99_12405 [Bacteroidetes bacterium]|nr:hypothetical protein [Bacteroidota bacterium]
MKELTPNESLGFGLIMIGLDVLVNDGKFTKLLLNNLPKKEIEDEIS